MRPNYFCLLLLLICGSALSQSREKREADIRMANQLEETHVFRQNPTDSTLRVLHYVENYDSRGRAIAKRTYDTRGHHLSYWQFEYPTDSTRVVLILMDDGRVIGKQQKPYNMLDRPQAMPEFNKNKTLQYEYNEDGQLSKVWSISPNWKDILHASYTYSPEGWLLESRQRKPRKDAPFYYLVHTYDRNYDGTIYRLTTTADDIVESIEYYVHTRLIEDEE